MTGKENKDNKETETETVEAQRVNLTQETTPDLKARHEANRVKNPIWTPEKDGDNLDLYVNEVIVLKDFNGEGKHSVILNCRTKIEKFPMVAFFPNSVALSQFERYTGNKNINPENFEEFKQSLNTLSGKTFNVMFKGTKPSGTGKGYNPYKDWSIVEI